MGNRTVLEINIEILERSKENIKTTHLMRDVNIAWQPLIDYVAKLKDKGLIDEIEAGEEDLKKDKRTKKFFCTTPKGIRVLQTFKDITQYVD